MRGDVLRELRQWDRATADYKKSIALGVENYRVAPALAHVELAVGDTKSYRRICKDLLDRFDNDNKQSM